MATLNISKRTNEVKILVSQAARDVLEDPDFGLELSEEAKKRIHLASASRKKTISFTKIKRKYC